MQNPHPLIELPGKGERNSRSSKQGHSAGIIPIGEISEARISFNIN